MWEHQKSIEELLEKDKEINFILAKHFNEDKYLSVVFYKNGKIKRNKYLPEINLILKQYNKTVEEAFKQEHYRWLLSDCEEYPGIIKKTLIGKNIIDNPDLMDKNFEENIPPQLYTDVEISHLFKIYPAQTKTEILEHLKSLGLNIDLSWWGYR